jgi:superfamily II DNA/RNA helicase
MDFPAKFSPGLAKIGVKAPNAMQADCLERSARGESFAVASPTGSGKTLAFLVPALADADAAGTKVRALVLSPTHDLAMQTVRVARDLTEGTGLRVGALAGNQSLDRQKETLKKKPHLVVGNPERVAILAKEGKLDLSECRVLVLDEADALLPKKAGEDIDTILKKLPRDVAVRLFSATYTDYSREAAARRWPQLAWPDFGQGAATGVAHAFCVCSPLRRGEELARLMKSQGSPASIVFCAKGGHVTEVLRQLEKRGVFPASIDHFTPPEVRKTVWADLREGRTKILVATDSAMRGIDLPGITHVWHWGLPFDARDWLHRAGRCGRFGRTGLSVAMLEPKERKTFAEWCAAKGVAPEDLSTERDDA